MRTIRKTMAQALIGYLKNQYVERDGQHHAFFAGVLGIFGHGNVAGIGQALQENRDFPYIPRKRAIRCSSGGGIRQGQQSPENFGMHIVHRARRDQHDYRRGACNRQPLACAAASRRYFCPP